MGNIQNILVKQVKVESKLKAQKLGNLIFSYNIYVIISRNST